MRRFIGYSDFVFNDLPGTRFRALVDGTEESVSPDCESRRGSNRTPRAVRLPSSKRKNQFEQKNSSKIIRQWYGDSRRFIWRHHLPSGK
jgi:hypothetical protein